MFRGLRLRSHEHQDTLHCGTLSASVANAWQHVAEFEYYASIYGRKYSSEDKCWDWTNPGPPFRNGGSLRIFHYADDLRLTANSTHYSGQPGTLYRYEGGFAPRILPASFNPDYTYTDLHLEATLGDDTLFPEESDAEQYGATAWRRMRPGNPTADLGIFVGEFRDIPRTLMGTAKFFSNLWKSQGGSRKLFAPKNIADNWLNVQFGWMPFLNDLRKFNRTYDRINDSLRRIIYQNNRWVKKSCSIGTDVETVVVGGSTTDCGLHPILPTSFYQSEFPFRSGSHTITSQRSTNVWAEGKFRYYIPHGSFEGGAWEKRARLALWGGIPSPALLWELTPWSWLVDWGSNVGDILSNLGPNAVENLVAKYAYVMKRTDVELRLNTTLELHDSTFQDTFVYPLSWKTRVKASPFGFSLSSAMFSARQWSILAALGLSRQWVNL